MAAFHPHLPAHLPLEISIGLCRNLARSTYSGSISSSVLFQMQPEPPVSFLRLTTTFLISFTASLASSGFRTRASASHCHSPGLVIHQAMQRQILRAAFLAFFFSFARFTSHIVFILGTNRNKRVVEHATEAISALTKKPDLKYRHQRQSDPLAL